MFHRRRHAFVPADRAEADEEVEHLPQRYVQRPDAAAHRRRERSLDADQVVTKGLDGIVRQPIVELLEALLTRVDLEPGDLPLAAVSLRDRGVEDAHAGTPNIRTGAVTFDERDDRIVRNDETAVFLRDGSPGGRRFEHRKGRHDRFRSHHQRDVTGSSQKLWKTLLKSSSIGSKVPLESAGSSGLHHRGAREPLHAPIRTAHYI